MIDNCENKALKQGAWVQFLPNMDLFLGNTIVLLAQK